MAERTHTGQSGQVLVEHWVALIRHRQTACLACVDEFFCLAHLGSLQIMHFGGQPLGAASDDAKHAENARVAVAGTDDSG
jgi:hypothetical protein